LALAEVETTKNIEMEINKMDDATKEQMTNVIKNAGMDTGMIDDDMVLILDDLAMDSEKLKKILMEKGADEMKTMEIMKKMTMIMMEKEDMSAEDPEW
jgi:hypothetical protein